MCISLSKRARIYFDLAPLALLVSCWVLQGTSGPHIFVSPPLAPRVSCWGASADLGPAYFACWLLGPRFQDFTEDVVGPMLGPFGRQPFFGSPYTIPLSFSMWRSVGIFCGLSPLCLSAVCGQLPCSSCIFPCRVFFGVTCLPACSYAKCLLSGNSTSLPLTRGHPLVGDLGRGDLVHHGGWSPVGEIVGDIRLD